MLGHFLEKEGQNCYYIDAPEQISCTSIAAGLINPITGRKFVKSWLIDELLPFAKATYQSFEEQFGEQLFFEPKLIRSLFNAGDENTWLARAADPEYVPYMATEADVGNLKSISHPVYAYAEVKYAAQVNVGQLCDLLRQKHRNEGRLLETIFDFEQLKIMQNQVKYGEVTADSIIFCEGWRMRYNPYFNHLPYQGTKGNVLHLRLPETKIDRIFKHRLFIIPFKDDIYWVGGNSRIHFTDEEPLDEDLVYITDRLDEMLTTPYEIVSHQSAIRPTVKDRRPFIGCHSEYPHLAIFNGMGTKGTSLAPYWAHHFVQHLVNGAALDKGVDIQRC